MWYSQYEFAIILLLVGRIQAFIFGIAHIFYSQHNKRANIFIGLAFIAFSLHSIHWKTTLFSSHINYGDFQLIWTNGLIFIGPLLYFYTRNLISAKTFWTKKDWLHFVPSFVYLAYLIYFFLRSYYLNTILQTNLPFPEEQVVLHNYRKLCEWDSKLWIFLNIFGTFNSIVYIYFSTRVVKKFKNWSTKNFATEKRITLNWLKLLFISIITLLVLLAVRDATSVFLGNALKINYLLFFAFAISISVCGFISFNLKEIPAIDLFETAAPKAKEMMKQKQDSERLIQLIEEKELYLENKLKLTDLAEKLNIPPKKLSHLIKTELNTNFYDLINRYRVEKVKQRLTDPAYSQYKLISIAFDCGFNSKSVFNNTFKKHTGFTPDEYRKKYT